MPNVLGIRRFASPANCGWSVEWEPLGDLATRNPEPPLPTLLAQALKLLRKQLPCVYRLLSASCPYTIFNNKCISLFSIYIYFLYFVFEKVFKFYLTSAQAKSFNKSLYALAAVARSVITFKYSSSIPLYETPVLGPVMVFPTL